MRRNLLTKIAAGSAVAALALGGVACEVDDAADPGLEDDFMDDGEGDF